MRWDFDEHGCEKRCCARCRVDLLAFQQLKILAGWETCKHTVPLFSVHDMAIHCFYFCVAMLCQPGCKKRLVRWKGLRFLPSRGLIDYPLQFRNLFAKEKTAKLWLLQQVKSWRDQFVFWEGSCKTPNVLPL